MNNIFNKFFQWIRFEFWKIQIIRISIWVRKVFNRFIFGIMWILKKFVEWLRWIIIPLALITLIAILIIACFKFFEINKEFQNVILEIKNDANTSVFSKLEYLTIMDDLKKGVFDSNVLTFMITLIIVFLGTILLNIENRARKITVDAKKTISQLESERNAMSLYTRLHMLHVFFVNKNYYRLAKESNELLNEFFDDKYYYITREWKLNFDNIIRNKMLYFLNIDKKYDEKNEDDINDSINALIELQKKINRLREI